MSIPRSLLGILLLSVSGFAADVAGVHNFHQVSDHLYRGAQPTTEGFRNLSRLGIKTIIDLRESGGRSVSEQRAVEADGMRYISMPMSGIHAPSDEQVAKLLAMVDDNANGPVFIHCRRGADRTGTICACYRISHDHWQNQRALDEAKSFGMAWFEKAMQHYVLGYQTAVNAAATAPAAAPAIALPAVR